MRFGFVLPLLVMFSPAWADMYQDGSNAKLPTGVPAAPVCQTAGGQLVAAPSGGCPEIGAALCDGVTDDSAAFSGVMGAGKNLKLPAGATCVVKDLSVTTRIDLNKGTLKIGGGALTGVKLTGTNGPAIVNGTIDDSAGRLSHATTLAATPAGGSSTITVASAAGFVGNTTPASLVGGMPVAIAMPSGYHFVTSIKQVSGTTITLLDPIPYEAASFTFTGGGATGGTGCAVGDYVENLSGPGEPIVAKVTSVSSGAVTGLTTVAAGGAKASPGKFFSLPGGTMAFAGIGSSNCVGLLANVTYTSPQSGAAVLTASPMLMLDGSYWGLVSDVVFKGGAIGFMLQDSAATSSGASHTYQNNLRNINCIGMTFVCWVRRDFTNNNTIDTLMSYSAIVGFYEDTRNWGTSTYPPSGGNKYFQHQYLGSEFGAFIQGVTLSDYMHVNADGQSQTAWVWGNSSNNINIGAGSAAESSLNGMVFVGGCDASLKIDSLYARFNGPVSNVQGSDIWVSAANCAPQVNPYSLGSSYTAYSTAKPVANELISGPVLQVHLFNNQPVASGTAADIAFDAVDIDTGKAWVSPNYIPKRSGTYEVCVTAQLSGVYTGGSQAVIGIQQNGVNGWFGGPAVPAFTGNTTASGCTLLKMNGTTDSIKAQATIVSTGGGTIAGGASRQTQMMIYRIGP